MTDSELFLEHIGKHYDAIQQKLKMLCGKNKQPYSQDYFHESIIRCTKAIEKKGKLNDTSPYGIESYLIRSYFNLDKEEARSCKNKKRDKNYNSDNISDLYEEYYNKTNNTAQEKIQSDLKKDFTTLYLILLVEQNFPPEYLYLFKLKHICNMTYSQVTQKTNIKAARQKILEVKGWLKENVTKEMINKSFTEIYGELLC